MSRTKMPLISLDATASRAHDAVAARIFANASTRPVTNTDVLAEFEKMRAAVTSYRTHIEGRVAAIEERDSASRAALRVTGGLGDDTPWTPARHRAAMRKLSNWLRNECPAAPQGINAGLQRDSNPDGGFVVDDEVVQAVEHLVFDESPIRRLAQVVPTNAAVLVRHTWTTEAASGGWLAEGGVVAETTGGKLSEQPYTVFDQYAQPVASNVLLEDARIDVGGEIATQIAGVFARTEAVSFLTGSGVGCPRGLTTYPVDTNPDSTRAYGTIEVRDVNFAGTVTAASNPIYDGALDAIYSMRAAHRGRAVWLACSTTIARLRKVKDLDGNNMWQRSNVDGEPDRFMGLPIETDENVLPVSAGNICLILADWVNAYTIVDRRGLDILRDPYTSKGLTKFFATKRVGAGLRNSNAVKFIRAS